MKISRYMVKAEIDQNSYLWYNCYNRTYLVVDQRNQAILKRIVRELGEGKTPDRNQKMVESLLGKRILVEDGEKDSKLISYMKPFLEARLNLSREEENVDGLMDRIGQMARWVSKLIINWYGSGPIEIAAKCHEMSDQIRKICQEFNCVYVHTIQTDGYLIDPFTLRKLSEAEINGVQCTLGSGTQTDTLIRMLEHGMMIHLRVNVNTQGYRDINQFLVQIPEEYRQNIWIHYCDTFKMERGDSLYHSYLEAFQMGYGFADRYCLIEMDGQDLECDEFEMEIRIRGLVEQRIKDNCFEEEKKLERKALLDYHADQFLAGRKSKIENQRHRTWKMG